jgi:carbonic anhydrase
MNRPAAAHLPAPPSLIRTAFASALVMAAAGFLMAPGPARASGDAPSHAPSPPPPIAMPVGTAKPGALPKSATAPAAAAPATESRSDPQVVAAKIKAVLDRHRGTEVAPPIPQTSDRVAKAIRNGHAAPEAHGGTATKGHDPHWAYEGANGPENWARVKPEFNACAIGKRQSPVHIQESVTLQGPAEPLQFDYRPSGGSVVNNGHTIQIDLEPGNTLSVRGSTYELLQFHFHHPSEERVNHRSFAMVAHLVHRNHEGQLAVVAVLIDPGEANGLIHKVWTHMPLDSGDRVRLPAGLIDLRELLPADQRYYQFMGSLTTPPCTEGVLWNVLKSPVTVSREQLRLFAQIFPNNARPVQALNGRVVREGM